MPCIILISWLTEFAVHESEFLPNGNYKRDRHRKRAEPGDRPWFCWFNQTMLEFFIYVDKSVQSSTSVVTPSTASSSITSSSSTSLPPALPLVTSIDKFSHPPFTGTEPYPPFMTASADNKKRESRRSNDLNNQDDDDDDDDVGLNYPLLVKIEEKRKPSDNIEPYCQQMRILEDGRIIPIVGVEQIEIPEEEASIEEDSIPPRLMVRGDASQPNEICACEWMNA